jgi:nicotinic acid mononucleotide adenylyltransferase
VARAAYPGTFDPPTVSHLAIAEAALAQGGVDEVHLVVSRQPLGKDPVVPPFEHRIAVLEAVATSRPWMRITVTTARLIADVAAGYDALILGADKWRQVVDPAWYGGSAASRDAAVASLPRVLLVPRGDPVDALILPPGAVVLDIGAQHRDVSSTAVRAGRRDWMLPEAASTYESIAMYEPHPPGAGG